MPSTCALQPSCDSSPEQLRQRQQQRPALHVSSVQPVQLALLVPVPAAVPVLPVLQLQPELVWSPGSQWPALSALWQPVQTRLLAQLAAAALSTSAEL